MVLLFIISFKNGNEVYVNEDDLVKIAYKNDDVRAVKILGKSLSLTLNIGFGERLIFFRKFAIFDDSRDTKYNIGIQKNVRGKNVKFIIEFDENNNMVIGG